MNLRLHHGGVHAQPVTILQSQIHRQMHDHLFDVLQRFRGEPVKGTIESVVFGNRLRIKIRESRQTVAIGDALAQLAIIPGLDRRKYQRAQDLGVQPRNPCRSTIAVSSGVAYKILLTMQCASNTIPPVFVTGRL
jgi:hypothetical protein